MHLTPCIPYEGGNTLHGGHKRIRHKGRMTLAHRAAYEEAHGPIPPGLVVRHKCDNPPCVNPEHLELGTQGDNNRDMVERGRHNPCRGGKSGMAILTEADVREIKRRLLNWEYGLCAKLAREFNVTSANISSIKAGKTWTHVRLDDASPVPADRAVTEGQVLCI